MTRQQIVTGVVGLLVGFIAGFFLATLMNEGAAQQVASSEMPENHPSPEMLQRLQQLLEKANADTNDVETRILIGNTYYDIGRYDAAIPWYEQALKLAPSNVSVSTDLGTSYLSMGNNDKAIEQYQKSLQMAPDHPQTLQNLGIAYFSASRFDEALDTWERLIVAHPEYPQADQVKQQIEAARLHLSTPSSAQ